MIQSASWTLKEQVTFDPHGITSVDWHSYPILRFREAPHDRDGAAQSARASPSWAWARARRGRSPAAIANAVFDAVGVRLRQIPFTPERVKEALGGVQAAEESR